MPRNVAAQVEPHDRPSTLVSLLSGWVQQGLESFFATQRILVDLAMRQNSNAIKTFREGITETEDKEKDCAMKILTEIAVEGSANYIEAQRLLLDMAQQENEIIMNGVKERVGDYATAVSATNVVRRSIETFIEMQQNFLLMASKHTQSWLQNSAEKKENKGLVGLAGEAMEEFAAAQKKFLDVISEETSGKKEHKKATPTELTTLGKKATESFIEAQKKLLDLAGHQVNVNLQAARRAMDLKAPIRLMPMAEMAGESVRSFVDAEKALLNTMKKARTHAKKEEEKPPTSRRRVRRPRRAAARAKAAAAEA
ncbi:MAG TPA: hypothetical protein VMT82_08045 [candidate division Zixibacteria bacterium]|nr:hypothetical protein [candidate division Zixibacteria bacterium]